MWSLGLNLTKISSEEKLASLPPTPGEAAEALTGTKDRNNKTTRIKDTLKVFIIFHSSFLKIKKPFSNEKGFDTLTTALR